MISYKNISNLIEKIEKFEKERASQENIVDFEREFALWLLSNRPRPGVQEHETTEQYIQGNIGRMLVFLSRYLDYYSKRLFKESEIYSITDFGFMMTLFPDKSLTRSELIESNLMEKPSGTEVIKRMLRSNLITEQTFGKKIKRVQLSETGLRELNRIMIYITKLGGHVTGDLSFEEKEAFLGIMTKLHFFHKPIFEKGDERQIREILGLDTLKDKEKNRQ